MIVDICLYIGRGYMINIFLVGWNVFKKFVAESTGED